MPFRLTGVVALLLAGAVLAACGDSGGGSASTTTAPVASTAAATGAASVPAAPAVLDDPSAQTLCDTLFAAWQAGDDDGLSTLASKAAIDALSGHSAKGAGLRATGQDCLLIETTKAGSDDVAAVGDVKMGLADGSPQALEITWTDAAGIDADQDFAKRVETTPLAVTPGGDTAGSTTAAAELGAADDTHVAAACVSGSNNDACTELGKRISAGLTDTARKQLLCIVYAPAVSPRATPVELAFLERLLGDDAPAAVTDAVAKLRDGSGDPTAAAALTAYVAPLCAS